MKFKHEYCLIINTASDSGRTEGFIRSREDMITAILGSVKFRYLMPSESLTEVTSREAESCKVIIACGGDGTVRNVAKGVIGKNTLLGILPCGSGNDFTRMLELPDSFHDRLRILKTCNVKKIDTIRFNGDYCINTLGIGFNGLTNHIARESSIWKGNIKYVIAALRTLFRFKRFKYRLETNTGTAVEGISPMIVIANGKWEGGGFLVSPDSDFSDGFFEVIVIKNLNLTGLIFEFVRLLLGLGFSASVFNSYSAKNAYLTTSETVFAHGDGEVVKPVNHFEIQINTSSINLIVV